MQLQLCRAGDVTHKIPHSRNEGSHNKYPTAQILKPMLGLLDLLVVNGQPVAVAPDQKST